MSKELSKDVTETKTIRITEWDSERCSRNCKYCLKSEDLYYCYLRGYEEEIEGLGKKNVNYDPEIPSADTYGFQRTEFCKKTFGN